MAEGMKPAFDRRKRRPKDPPPKKSAPARPHRTKPTTARAGHAIAMAPLLLPLRLRLLPLPAATSAPQPAQRPRLPFRRHLRLPGLQCLAGPGLAAPSSPPPPPPPAPRWHATLSAAAGLYPAYVTAGAAVAVARPEAFRWFVAMAPGSYTCALGLIMLAMGLTLELRDFVALLRDRPLAILFGCAAQYTIMPALGAIVSRVLGLPPSLSVGLILLGCCPGGTASNVVTLVAKGDVPLSIVMTICSTLAAVFLTPLLTKILAGAYIPVDAVKLSLSTLQVVVAPILLGSSIQTAFPSVVKYVTPFAPLLAVLASSLLACSVFSDNFVRLRSTIADASCVNGSFFSGDIGVVMLSVSLLHFAGFFVGYAAAAIGCLKERQRRAISIEVGMQNSSLGVVLAAAHFSSPLVALPPALSAVIMNIMGSTLGLVWQYITPSVSENETTDMPDA
ncbi:probable sodium/metabolite cotransporter BASS1, chloroplastic [Phragmites australis]|uniref:probable sodium/metabolite cotransporter BASS1, chloroplastic n=1 Tax=Phragmites australis TaxID=29695 RepID=UPI002D777781|nr:probable sodium/metabolite cotransporter BASS1, chloroplastic [Phragmites australis]